jgi:hypothetical protein
MATHQVPRILRQKKRAKKNGHQKMWPSSSTIKAQFQVEGGGSRSPSSAKVMANSSAVTQNQHQLSQTYASMLERASRLWFNSLQGSFEQEFPSPQWRHRSRSLHIQTHNRTSPGSHVAMVMQRRPMVKSPGCPISSCSYSSRPWESQHFQ